MALFSRGPKANDSRDDAATPQPESDTAATDAGTDAADAGTADAGTADAGTAGAAEASTAAEGEASDAASHAPSTEDAEENVPSVGISTTSYGGFGADAPAEPQAAPTGEAPEPTQSIPGLPDNVVLQASLAALSAEPEGHEILGVARQLLQGNVYLRIKGNAQELVSSGAELPLAIATRDEGQFVMIYSSGAALAAAVNADGDTETSAMGQAGPAVLQYVLQGGFAGAIVDHASAPAAVVLPRALIERMTAEMDQHHTLKRLVSGPRTAETAAAVAEALTTAPLWIAVNRTSDDEAWGVAESRSESGERILPVFSHPLEVIALGRGDQPVPFSPAQLGSALRSDEDIAGVVVDPAGPWIRLERDDLGPVLALPEPEPAEQIADEDDGADEGDASTGGADEGDASTAGADVAAADDAAADDASSSEEGAGTEGAAENDVPSDGGDASETAVQDASADASVSGEGANDAASEDGAGDASVSGEASADASGADGDQANGDATREG